MQYAVIGTGVVGRTLAAGLAALGHEVTVGTRDVRQTLERTEPDGYGTPPYSQWSTDHPGIRLRTFAEAAHGAEVVVNASAGAASLAALTAAGADNLAGKLLIDVANPLDFSRGMPPTLNPVNTDSLGEQIQRAFPAARVVKTLNTMNTAVMVDPRRVPGPHNVFVCGDDETARKEAAGLLADLGWPSDWVIDLGDLTAARGLEQILPLWLRIWGTLGHADFNFLVQRAR
ncbi:MULTISPECIES: NADPH-dependent F420 reductase [unclassified Kitasatospora]|uniref:NADPH-dependent F420 reductase n=1 Tax=unclassified Kitasatospora TaxID=2633591 RepID=UPI00070AAD58|nr:MULTISPECIES: NAD(P)-binding domain-containing protein [unclassified Kitasatospora]KQV15316.1 NADP oxidoreductase [Kitasatospora sp. Root107]KRB64096.1 NADP oxidoreductase [Kitasatospora sp. Root187]